MAKSTESLATVRQAAVDNPDSARAQLEAGTALIKAGLAKEAATCLRRAVELDPESVEAWVNLGGVLLSQWDFDGCRDANQRATEIDPASVPAHYNLGLAHLYGNRAEPMLACFDRVVKLEPENAGAHYHRAVALNALGRTEEARVSLETSIRLGHTPDPRLIKALEKKADHGKLPVVGFEVGPKKQHGKNR